MDKKERIAASLEFAARMHEGQTRIGGEPYITHPVAVAKIVADWGFDLDFQITALFHDLLEDTCAARAEIERLGGTLVLKAVQLLTKEPGYTMEKYVTEIKENRIARTVKAADRLHNLRCAVDADVEFRKRYIRETVEWYMDLCPEIAEAAKQLAKSLPEPMEEFSFLYT